LARALVGEKVAEAERQAAAATQQVERYQERLRTLRLREAALGLMHGDGLVIAVRIVEGFPSSPARLLETVAGIIVPVALAPETPPPL
jgi:hypothetical protein